MQFLLNIGLESKTLGKIAPVTAISAARLNGLTVTRTAVVQSDTEPTLVVEAQMSAVRAVRAIHTLAEDLGQDCIAAYYPGDAGWLLVGPRATEWGPFNPEFFLLLDGTRLQTPAAKAA